MQSEFATSGDPRAELWKARAPDVALEDDMKGYTVEGRDGTVGKVERITYERTCFIVSTSRLFGKRYVVPAGSVERVDRDSRKVLVDLSKEEVENSPSYDDHQGVDEECQATMGAYYGDLLAHRSSVR